MKIFFDIDGTLFKSQTIAVPAFSHCLQTLGFPVPDEATLLNTLGYPISELWQMLLPGVEEEIIEKAGHIMEETEVAMLTEGKGKLFPHVRESLAYLSEQGHQLYTLSNCQIPYLNQIVTTFKLEPFFTELHCAGLHPGETKAQILKKVLKGDSNAIMVGDRHHDITAGKLNDITTVWCNYGFSQTDEIDEPDFIIKDMWELIDIVEKLSVEKKNA